MPSSKVEPVAEKPIAPSLENDLRILGAHPVKEITKTAAKPMTAKEALVARAERNKGVKAKRRGKGARRPSDTPQQDAEQELRGEKSADAKPGKTPQRKRDSDAPDSDRDSDAPDSDRDSDAPDSDRDSDAPDSDRDSDAPSSSKPKTKPKGLWAKIRGFFGG